MGILQFFVICCVIGFVVWMIQKYAPIPQEFKTIALWAGLIVVLFILASALGLLGHDWMIPRLR
jgi:hypothetical protein